MVCTKEGVDELPPVLRSSVGTDVGVQTTDEKLLGG